MREEILSRVQPDKLLHVVFRRADITEARTDICDPAEGLQVACFRLPAGKTLRAHEHIPRPRTIERTQETWIVVSGRVRATYYDIDGLELDKATLGAGDCSITFEGGHNYLALEDGTEVVECKTGPFVGVEQDKRFLA